MSGWIWFSVYLLIHLYSVYQFYLLWYFFSHYSFATSIVEFWFLSLLRSSILFASIIAALFNPQDARRRLHNVSVVFLLTAAAIAIFTIIKLLFRADLSAEDLSEDVWFWVQFSWSLFAAAGFYACVLVLITLNTSEEGVGATKAVVQARGVSQEGEVVEGDGAINSTVDERTRLIIDPSPRNTQSESVWDCVIIRLVLISNLYSLLNICVAMFLWERNNGMLVIHVTRSYNVLECTKCTN